MNKKIVYGAVAVGVGYLIYKSMQKKQGLGDDQYLLTPPTGRTRTLRDPMVGFGEDPYLLTAPPNGTFTINDPRVGFGDDPIVPWIDPDLPAIVVKLPPPPPLPVVVGPGAALVIPKITIHPMNGLGGLGLGYHEDVYDAAPYQYSRQVINDMEGLGGWFKKARKAVKKAVAPAVKVVQSVTKPIAHVTGISQAKKPGGVAATVYTDENGKTITKAQYDQALADAAKYTPVKAEDYGGHTVWSALQKAGGTKYLVDYVASGNTCSFMGDTKAAAEGYIDSLNPAQFQPVKASDYKGHTIWTVKQQAGGVVYLVDFDATANTASDQEDTMALAQLYIDNKFAPAKVGTFPPPVSKNDGTYKVTFAQVYGGHAISTMTQPGGGVVYLVDVAQGSTVSGGGFDSSYPTMSAAQAAIDAANPPIPQQAPVQANLPPPDMTPQQYAPAPAAQYRSPAPVAAAPAKAGSAVGTAAAVAGAGLLAFFAMK